MSVETSSANIDPPPLLFGQRSPSPPSSASVPSTFLPPPQPLSPSHIQRLDTPPPPAQPSPVEPASMDQHNSHVTNGQDHDREGSPQNLGQDTQAVDTGNALSMLEQAPALQAEPQQAPELEGNSNTAEAMDTTPDGTPPRPEQEPLTPPPPPPQPPPTTTDAQQPTHQNETSDIPQTTRSSSPILEGDQDQSATENTQVNRGDALMSSSETPEGSPPGNESSQLDDEDDSSWVEIQEDTSMPNEEELKEIEEEGERSALDHEHWESKTFEALDEDEYTPGPSGRMEWVIEHYNGTKQHPNRDLVMKSPPFEIGNHLWQIKFYPKGNDSDYLSIYIECLSVTDRKSAAGSTVDGKQDEEDMTDARPLEETQLGTETQHSPLPLIDTEPLPKRRSVAAQVSLVLYNPDEPRTNYWRSCLHRFCPGSPDWGWTRFYGPYYEIQHRRRGQRQALLRNDKLAFTAYIRVIDDKTDCLWEHSSASNPWDCYAMTGLQGLQPPETQYGHGGNVIAALSSWLNLRPFRELLYKAPVPDPIKEGRVRPMPVISALLKILYMLRNRVQPNMGCVSTDDLVEALEWYGVELRLAQKDVVEFWAMIRIKLEQELEGTPLAHQLTELFGPCRNTSLGQPKYRAPVKGVKTVQEAINRSKDSFPTAQQAPKILHIELERQDFDEKTRSWKKLTDKIHLDERVLLHQIPYQLFGFIVHKDNLQSGRYSSVLRPDGPEKGKWYQYRDSKDDQRVKCLTKRQALHKHQGSSDSNGSVAYVLLYIREDICETAFDGVEPTWNVPGWVVEQVMQENATESDQSIYAENSAVQQRREGLTDTNGTLPDIAAPEDAAMDLQQRTTSESDSLHDNTPETVSFQVFHSPIFASHTGPGLIDPYGPHQTEHIHNIEVKNEDSHESLGKLRAAVASALGPERVLDPRQVQLWSLSSIEGYDLRPRLLAVEMIDFVGAQSRFDSVQRIAKNDGERRLWAYIQPHDDFQTMLEEWEELTKAAEARSAEVHVSTNEDTIMSEPDDDDADDAHSGQDENSSPQNNENHSSGNNQNGAINDRVQPSSTPPQTDDAPPYGEHSNNQNVAVVIEPPAGGNIGDQTVPSNGMDEDVDPSIGNGLSSAIPPPSADTEMGDIDTLPPPETQAIPPPPPPGDFHPMPPATPSPPPPAPDKPLFIPPRDRLYVLVKRFDMSSQTMTAIGDMMVKKKDPVFSTIRRILQLKDDAPLEIYSENDNLSARALDVLEGSTFSSVGVRDTDILIARFPATLHESTIPTLSQRAWHVNPHYYIRAVVAARNSAVLAQPHHQTRDFFSAEFFSGEVAMGGLPHGPGRMTYHNGDRYEGSFALGKRHGTGRMIYSNGDIYEGAWVADARQGNGTFIEKATGNRYSGGWKADRRHGEGVTHWKIAQDVGPQCRICWEAGADAAFYDCGHVVACLACARRLESCPVCRRRVLQALKLYLVS